MRIKFNTNKSVHIVNGEVKRHGSSITVSRNQKSKGVIKIAVIFYFPNNQTLLVERSLSITDL